MMKFKKQKHKLEWLYIHTIEGIPANFNGNEIIRADGVGGRRGINSVAPSVIEIRKEQLKSIRWRVEEGLPKNWQQYHYVRINKKCIK